MESLNENKENKDPISKTEEKVTEIADSKGEVDFWKNKYFQLLSQFQRLKQLNLQISKIMEDDEKFLADTSNIYEMPDKDEKKNVGPTPQTVIAKSSANNNDATQQPKSIKPPSLTSEFKRLARIEVDTNSYSKTKSSISSPTQAVNRLKKNKENQGRYSF